MMLPLVDSSRCETDWLIPSRTEPDAAPLQAWTPSSEELEDVMDIQAALAAEALYLQLGRSAFVSLKAYRERRRRRRV